MWVQIHHKGSNRTTSNMRALLWEAEMAINGEERSAAWLTREADAEGRCIALGPRDCLQRCKQPNTAVHGKWGRIPDCQNRRLLKLVHTICSSMNKCTYWWTTQCIIHKVSAWCWLGSMWQTYLPETLASTLKGSWLGHYGCPSRCLLQSNRSIKGVTPEFVHEPLYCEGSGLKVA